MLEENVNCNGVISSQIKLNSSTDDTQVYILEYDNTFRIVPTTIVLESSNGQFECPYPNCNRHVLRNCSLVRHLETHYPDKGTLHVLYHCKIETCPYSILGVKSFKSLKYLRQHWRKVHRAKLLLCYRCEKPFGTSTYLSIHERICGVSFNCSCDASFTSLEALQTHSRRKNHSFDLDKYRKLITHAKSVQEEVLITKSSTNSSVRLKKADKNIGKKVKVPIPIFPARNQFSSLQLSNISTKITADFGTQTSPGKFIKKVKRCKSVASSTEKNTFQNRAKTSIQTQTKRLYVSTETQTPVVTKRRRNTPKRQSNTVTTQTPPPSKSLILSPATSTSSKLSISSVFSPLLALASTATQFEKGASDRFASIFDNFDEDQTQTSQTQTEPNPFFGYPNSIISKSTTTKKDNSSTNFFLFDYDDDVSNLNPYQLKTTETQTPSRSNVLCTPPSISTSTSVMLDCFELHDTTLGNEEDDAFNSYLETMDNETQTNFYEEDSWFNEIP